MARTEFPLRPKLKGKHEDREEEDVTRSTAEAWSMA